MKVSGIELERRLWGSIGNLHGMTTGIASFALAASIMLWKSTAHPVNVRLYAVLFGSASVALYIAGTIFTVRSKKKVTELRRHFEG